MIDRLREQIQQRLDRLAGEADRLRKALVALDPRLPAAPAPKARAGNAAPPRRPARTGIPEPEAPAAKTTRARRASQSAGSTPRTAPGPMNAPVLAALADGEAMTAGQAAEKTGLARGTVSTTLSKLANSSEVQKAQRGYRLAPDGQPSGAPSPAPTAASECRARRPAGRFPHRESL